MHAVYLHGFASSPDSSKARFLAERLAARGVEFHCPDLNEPDFSTLTVSRMIGQTEALLRSLPPEPAVLMGSSLGGFVAWHVAARAAASAPAAGAHIDRLVLLAPAFDFGMTGWPELGEDGLTDWRKTGTRTFFHYGYGEPRPLDYALYEDARRYRSDLARVPVPTLVFHGTRDETVNPDMIIAFAAARPGIILRLLDDGHQLLEQIEVLWAELAAYVKLELRT